MIDFLTENSGIIGLLFFFTFFVVTAIMLWLPGRKKRYEDFGKMPFLEDENNDEG